MTAQPRKRVDFVVPSGSSVASCRACGKRIVWVMNRTTERRMPLDFESTIVAPVLDDNGDPKQGEYERRAESHFAHCSKAGAFRRRRKR